MHGSDLRIQGWQQSLPIVGHCVSTVEHLPRLHCLRTGTPRGPPVTGSLTSTVIFIHLRTGAIRWSCRSGRPRSAAMTNFGGRCHIPIGRRCPACRRPSSPEPGHTLSSWPRGWILCWPGCWLGSMSTHKTSTARIGHCK